MDEAVAYSTLAMTVALAVSQPRVGTGSLRVTPGMAAVLGVAVLFAGGLLHVADLAASARIQWRPLLSLACIMLMTGVVKEVGAFERLAHHVEAYARGTTALRAFNLIFAAAVLTPAILNNDAAILLLTPVVVALSERSYPGKEDVREAFAFAVFLAPGVAPLVISNPMNMIVAEFSHIGFNAYAAIMAPISLVGALLTYCILRLRYRHALRAPTAVALPVARRERHPGERPALALLLAVFFCYPVFVAFGAPLWSVSAFGAIGCVLLGLRYGIAGPRTIASHVSVDILAFLWGVFLVVAGLRSVGIVDRLAAFYRASEGNGALHIGVIGTMAALGSAIVDNHPMSILNMMALGDHHMVKPLLAALIGGDIGPRLLPIGSLAGLLWMDLLRRQGVEIGIGRFVRLGTAVLVPTLAVSLALLWLR
jgi:arsenical pump membrane protein